MTHYCPEYKLQISEKIILKSFLETVILIFWRNRNKSWFQIYEKSPGVKNNLSSPVVSRAFVRAICSRPFSVSTVVGWVPPVLPFASSPWSKTPAEWSLDADLALLSGPVCWRTILVCRSVSTNCFCFTLFWVSFGCISLSSASSATKLLATAFLIVTLLMIGFFFVYFFFLLPELSSVVEVPESPWN